MVDMGLFLQVVGTLGFGSVLGQYLSSGGQRRATRAEVLRALSTCEQARWHPRAEDVPTLGAASRELVASAVVARMSPVPVKIYVEIAGVAARASRESWEYNPDEEFGGGIDADLAQLTSDAAGVITDLAWAPVRHRVGLRQRLSELETRAKSLKQFQHVNWDRLR